MIWHVYCYSINMSPIHGLVLVACLLVPVICGFSNTCAGSIKEVIAFASTVAVGVLGNAGVIGPKKEAAPTTAAPAPCKDCAEKK